MSSKMTIDLQLDKDSTDCEIIFNLENSGETISAVYGGNLLDFICNLLNEDFIEIFCSYEFNNLKKAVRNNTYSQKFESKIKSQISYYETLWKEKSNSKINYDNLFTKGSVSEYVYKNYKTINFGSLKEFINNIFLKDKDTMSTPKERFFIYELIAVVEPTLFMPNSNNLETTLFLDLNIPTETEFFQNKAESLILKKNYTVEKTINNLVALLKKKKQTINCGERYTFNNLQNLTGLILNILILKNKMIEKCQCCGKYFALTSKRPSKYCNNLCPYDTEKTCSEYVKYQKYLYHNQNSETVKLYRQIYNSLNNKYKRCGSGKIWSTLEDFKIDATVWRTEVKSNPKLENDYLNWLKQKKSEFIKNGR